MGIKYGFIWFCLKKLFVLFINIFKCFVKNLVFEWVECCVVLKVDFKVDKLIDIF